jgi:hypothetical protein
MSLDHGGLSLRAWWIYSAAAAGSLKEDDEIGDCGGDHGGEHGPGYHEVVLPGEGLHALHPPDGMLQLQHLPIHALGRHHNYVFSHRKVCAPSMRRQHSNEPYMYIYMFPGPSQSGWGY